MTDFYKKQADTAAWREKNYGSPLFVTIPLGLFRFLQVCTLRNNERAVLDFIISKTASYCNEWDRIALSQISESTLMSTGKVSTVLKSLEKKGYVKSRPAKNYKKCKEYALPTQETFYYLHSEPLVIRVGSSSLPTQVVNSLPTQVDTYTNRFIRTIRRLRMSTSDINKKKNNNLAKWTRANKKKGSTGVGSLGASDPVAPNIEKEESLGKKLLMEYIKENRDWRAELFEKFGEDKFELACKKAVEKNRGWLEMVETYRKDGNWKYDWQKLVEDEIGKL